MDQNNTFRPVGQIAALVVGEVGRLRQIRAADATLDLLNQADRGPVDPLTLGRAIVAVLESFPADHPMAEAIKDFSASLHDLRADPEATDDLAEQVGVFVAEDSDNARH